MPSRAMDRTNSEASKAARRRPSGPRRAWAARVTPHAPPDVSAGRNSAMRYQLTPAASPRADSDLDSQSEGRAEGEEVGAAALHDRPQDVEVQLLVFVNHDVSKADHCPETTRQGAVKPPGFLEQREGIGAGLRYAHVVLG